MPGLREQIDAESRHAVERRQAARMLGNNAFIDWLIDQEGRPAEPYVISRDPCPKCAIRGDLGCAHRKASRPEEAPERRWRNPEVFRAKSLG